MWKIFRLFIIFLIFTLYNVYYFIIIPKAVSTMEEGISTIDEFNELYMLEENEQNRELESESTNNLINDDSNSEIELENNTNSEQNLSSFQVHDRHIFYKTTANNINHPIQDFIGNSLSQFISTIEIDKAKEHFLFNLPI